MKLKSFGCSFTYGTDLSDAVASSGSDQRHSLMTWPALLAEKLGYDYHCYAHGGEGNLCILSRLLDQLNRSKDSYYVINWTFIDRFDYRDLTGGVTGNNDWIQIRPGDTSDLAKSFYSQVHSEYRDKVTSLMAVYTALTALQQKRQKFIMTSIDNLMLDETYHIDGAIKLLQNYVRPYLINFDGLDFLSWSKAKHFDISIDNHPLEQAHAAAADLLWNSLQLNQLKDHNAK